MDDFTIDISIPTDDDGFVLLQCPKCGEYFKLPPADNESEDVLDIYCPLCGLISDNYLTEDVIELAQAKALNHVLGDFYVEMKKLERKSKNSIVKIKANKPNEVEEIPIKSTIDSMEIIDFECCNREAKIRHLLNYCGCYCPYCGGHNDGSN